MAEMRWTEAELLACTPRRKARIRWFLWVEKLAAARPLLAEQSDQLQLDLLMFPPDEVATE